MEKNVIALIIFTIGSAIFLYFFLKPAPTNKIKISINNTNYDLEIAKSISQKSKGLMNRTSLCPNCGMIFVSSLEMPQVFWMKNTLIPLDMVFLDKDGQVINIETALPEAKTEDGNYQLFKSSRPAKYVIELNAGDSQKINLKPYDKIDISQL